MSDAAALPAHLALRAATGASHEMVDAAYGTFDLADAGSYADFLTAHARILPAVEAVLADRADLPSFEARTPALAADLAALGRTMPETMRLAALRTDAAAWGMLYVIEGSRLGGVMLARSVPDDLPKTYLAAAHARGGWRALLAELDRAGADGDRTWLPGAIAAAREIFDAYAAAARV